MLLRILAEVLDVLIRAQYDHWNAKFSDFYRNVQYIRFISLALGVCFFGGVFVSFSVWVFMMRTNWSMIKSQLHWAETKIQDGDRYLLDVTKISKVMQTFCSIQRHTTTNVNLYWVLGNEYVEDGTKAAMTYVVPNAYTILTIRHLDFSFIWIFLL